MTTTMLIVLAASQLACFVLLFALARELGVVLVRLGPVGAPSGDTGLGVGSRVEPIQAMSRSGNSVTIGGAHSLRTLLVFMSPQCSVCEDLMPGLKALARETRSSIRTVAISGTDTERDGDYARELAHVGISYISGADHLRLALGVGSYPYGVLLDEGGVIQSKGFVNNLEHLESLFALEVFSLSSEPSKAGSVELVEEVAQ